MTGEDAYQTGERVRIVVSIGQCYTGRTYRKNRHVVAFDQKGRELRWDSGRDWRIGYSTTITATVEDTLWETDTETKATRTWTELRRVVEASHDPA